ncbi:MAG: TRAP transporter small permease [Alphaproteobacteria bacterium]
MDERIAESAVAKWGRRGLGSISGLCLFAMMTLTFVDVIGRYILGAPLKGAYELTEYLLPLMVFSALPLVTARNEHVTTGLFEKSIKGRVLELKRLSVHIACFIACAYLAYALYGAYAASHTLLEASQQLGIPKSPIIGLAAVASAVAAILSALLAAFGGRAGGVTDEQGAA